MRPRDKATEEAQQRKRRRVKAAEAQGSEGGGRQASGIPTDRSIHRMWRPPPAAPRYLQSHVTRQELVPLFEHAAQLIRLILRFGSAFKNMHFVPMHNRCLPIAC